MLYLIIKGMQSDAGMRLLTGLGRNVMISVCIITKNEKKALKKCLEQLNGYPVEVVVVDTGSTDGTMEMARQYTKSLYEFEWCSDFAKAKNYAVSKAVNNTVLVVDSDEYLRSINMEELAEQIKKFPRAVGRIERINQICQNGEMRESREYINRLFDRRYFHYTGKIHEQVTALDGGAYETYVTSIVVDHSGYLLSEDARQEKAQRNLLLLQEVLKEDGPDPYILYQLGKSYYMSGSYELACKYFSEALSFDLDPNLEYVIDLVDCYGYAMLNGGHAADALAFEGIYKEFGHRADFQFLMGLIYMNNGRFEQAVCEFQKAAGQKECRITGVNSYLANYNIGVIYECLGKKEKAVEYYTKCGGYEPALNRIGQCGREGVKGKREAQK